MKHQVKGLEELLLASFIMLEVKKQELRILTDFTRLKLPCLRAPSTQTIFFTCKHQRHKYKNMECIIQVLLVASCILTIGHAFYAKSFQNQRIAGILSTTTLRQKGNIITYLCAFCSVAFGMDFPFAISFITTC